jgi:hypothetical protein
MSNKQQTAVEWLETEIDNELKVIDNLYGKEIIGRKIAFAFVKKILIEAKAMEKEQTIDAHIEGQRVFDDYKHTQWTTDQAEEYYKETYGK